MIKKDNFAPDFFDHVEGDADYFVEENGILIDFSDFEKAFKTVSRLAAKADSIKKD